MQFAVYGGELMRDAVGNDDDFAFADLMFLAAFDFRSANFVRPDFLCVDGFSTGDQRGRSIAV